jgi:mannose-1-phosphate guanylyltransferase
MKILIFAGGSGTRFWPLSKQSYPKQFKKIFDGKSTLQLAVERVEKPFGIENVYISVNEKYVPLVKEQLPQVLESNIVGEPAKRNVAPAIGYNLVRLKQEGYEGPIAILWADHLMGNVQNFIDVLKKGEELISKNPKKMVFVGEKPRYAENNLGWINFGKETNPGVHEFVGWHYKPPVDKCKKMFESGEWFWNPGYFVTHIDFAIDLYKKYAPEMLGKLNNIKDKKTLNEIYPTLESVSFDKKILEKLKPEQAVVVKADMDWSDPGTLYALKEALIGKGDANLVQGLTRVLDTKDSVVINEEENKLVTSIGLDGMIVVNTKDAILVVHKEDILKLTELVKQLQENESLKKFT